MSRWPPLIWPGMSLAALLVLIGVGGDWNPWALAAGVVLALAVFAAAAYFAMGRWGGRPRPEGSGLALAALAGYYVIAAICALFLDPVYVLAALGAGIIPLTAALLLLATMRAKSVHRPGAEDTAADAADDAFPGIGMDSSTPLGDTSEHSDAIGGAGESRFRDDGPARG
jgi:hypothetical protein